MLLKLFFSIIVFLIRKSLKTKHLLQLKENTSF